MRFALWHMWLVAILAEAAENRKSTIYYDTSPQVIDDLNTTLAVQPAVLHPESPLLNPSRLQKRTKIELTIAVATVALAGQGFISNAEQIMTLYNQIAAKIFGKSEANSCTLIYGTEHDDQYYMGYAYQATTTGSNCETTALNKTIDRAVQNCATKLHDAKAVVGCCNFQHGSGSWHGHLKLTANPEKYPAHTAVCPVI